MKIKISRKGVIKMLLLSGVILFEFVGIYLVARYDYLESRFPVSVENFIQTSGVWRIFGAKDYSQTDYSSVFALNPDLKWVKSFTMSSDTGYLTKYVRSEDRKSVTLGLTSMDQPEREYTIQIADVLKLCKKDDCSIPLTDLYTMIEGSSSKESLFVKLYKSSNVPDQSLSYVISIEQL